VCSQLYGSSRSICVSSACPSAARSALRAARNACRRGLGLGRLLDQDARVVDLLRVDAVQRAVRLEVDPGVQLDRRTVFRPAPVGRREQVGEGRVERTGIGLGIDAAVVPLGRGSIAGIVELLAVAGCGELGERLAMRFLHGVNLGLELRQVQDRASEGETE
jgi:hypothetical protein